eukprot:GHVT01094661.1.p2 GENE.GHVT01094661.1~~GHVT01094661.1.p2  ORF type:complete len:167 (-),score=26.48 GHVT01094661.1:361-861(-)
MPPLFAKRGPPPNQSEESHCRNCTKGFRRLTTGDLAMTCTHSPLYWKKFSGQRQWPRAVRGDLPAVAGPATASDGADETGPTSSAHSSAIARLQGKRRRRKPQAVRPRTRQDGREGPQDEFRIVKNITSRNTLKAKQRAKSEINDGQNGERKGGGPQRLKKTKQKV